MSRDPNLKWIIITGGNLSGLGKGIVAGSIAKLLAPNKIVNVKCDGYLNVDPGTINPFEHGEVYVLDDGGEVDMDFGHYERFTLNSCKSSWNLTSGKIFDSVIGKERKGDYLGKTVQIFPHLIDEIKGRLYALAAKEHPDIMMVEIGGTIDDIETSWFVRAVRELATENPGKVFFCHLVFVPKLQGVGEQKTRLAQSSIENLLLKGIRPDIVIGRAEDVLQPAVKEKIARFTGLPVRAIISDPHMTTVYELPLIFEQEGLRTYLQERMGITTGPALLQFNALVQKVVHPKQSITIALCGKYTNLHDSYASVHEALVHAGASQDCKVNVQWVETSDIHTKEDAENALAHIDGIIVPGGFGKRGIEGKILLAQYAREHKIPYLGLCLGLQIAVIEFARNVCGLAGANSTEFKEEGVVVAHPVIDILPEQIGITTKGATMRLGAYQAMLKAGSIVASLYGAQTASERHRHRFEVNPDYHKILSEKGLLFSGMSPNGRLVEYIELPDHPFFVGTQAHPEFTSRLEKPNPLFKGFVEACVKKRQAKKE